MFVYLALFNLDLQMATELKNLSQYDAESIPSAAEFKFGIVVSEWNAHITHTLYKGCLDSLIEHGADEDSIKTIQVPGSFELPLGARLLLSNGKFDAVICIGCVIKGETKHDEYINQSVSIGLTNLSLTSGIPCIFGVLTPNTEEQALDRAGGKHGNKGVEAAITAIRMAALKKGLTVKERKIGFQS